MKFPMKKSIIILMTLLLAGCFNPKSNNSSNSSNESSYEQSSSEQSSQGGSNVEKIRTIDIYASNDIHGAVFEDNGCGIGKFATFFKEKGEQMNTLLLDQGDTWQGIPYHLKGIIARLLERVQLRFKRAQRGSQFIVQQTFAGPDTGVFVWGSSLFGSLDGVQIKPTIKGTT